MPAEGRKVKPMRQIRAAVIGVGYLGRFHAEKFLKLPNVRLVGVVDVDKKRSDDMASRLGTTPFYSFEDLLDRSSVDAVSVVTPTETHYCIAKEFLARGISVMLEKPMTRTVSEAEKLIEEAERNNVVLQIGHLERFNAAVVAMDGKDVAPLFIESDRLSSFQQRGTDVDVVLDLMIHDIDIILNLVKSDIVSVDAVGVPVVTGKVDIANARLKFRNGCVANVTASRVSKRKMRKIRLFQPKEYVSIDYDTQNIAIFRKKTNGGMPEIVEEDIRIDRSDTLLEEIKAFVDCVAHGGEPLVSGRDGKRALEVAMRIQKSISGSLKGLEATVGRL